MPPEDSRVEPVGVSAAPTSARLHRKEERQSEQTAAHSEPPAAVLAAVGSDHSPRPGISLLTAALGVLLLLLAGLVNYSSDFIEVVPGRVTVHLDSTSFSFPVWWVIAGVLLLLLGLGMTSAQFRRVAAFPWRNRSTAVPVLTAILLLGFTLIPWEYRATFPEDSGSAILVYLSLASAGFLFLAVGLYPWLGWLERLAENALDWLLACRPWVLMLTLFAFAFALANIISLAVFQHIAHIPDSISQLFQARLFASGHLYLPSPHFREFFDSLHIINNGHWYSQYPPFHSVLLALGALAGMPWIVNPLLGALTAPTVYLLGREVYDERTGRFAGVLAGLSPFIINMSAEFMNHTSTLLLLTLALLFFFRLLKQGRIRHALLAGLFLGLAAGTRPFTALAMMIPFAVYAIRSAQVAAWSSGPVKDTRPPGHGVTRPLFGFAMRYGLLLLTLTLCVGLMLVYNRLVNGAALRFGYVVRWGAGHEIGFGHSGWGASHTPLRGLVNTGNNLNGLNRYLFEWPLPGLLPLVLLFLSGAAHKEDRLLLASFLALTIAYSFYWYQDLCFGPRFLFESTGVLVLLTARGFQAVGPLLRRRFGLTLSDASVRRMFLRVLPLALLVTAGIGIPPLYLNKYRSYYGIDASLVQTVQARRLKNALVFCYDLGDAYSWNSLNLNGPVVYAQDYGGLNSALTVAYPDRQYFYGNGDSLVPIPQIAFPHSELRQTLDQMTNLLPQAIELDHRTVIWPFADLAPEHMPDNVVLTDFRHLADEFYAGTGEIEDHLPALACWLADDPRENVTGFTYLNGRESFITDKFKFTLLSETENSRGLVYDIRLTTGQELIRDRDRP